MKNSMLLSVLSGAALLQCALALFPKTPRAPPLELLDDEITALLDTTDVLTGNGTFEQYIDHTNPSLGTFSQAYWWNATFWKGPGSPVIFNTPGEAAAVSYTGYLTDRTLTGLYAKAVGGAVILFEHRYWGNSTPFANQTTKNLQFHSLEQAVNDFTRFAQKVQLPFDTSGSTNAPQAPWVFVGGSYPGALASWVEKLVPGTFWAYHGSSGPVETIYDYWQYFYPIQDGMPKNCSKDYEAIIGHVDDVFTSGTTTEKKKLKELFALDALEHDDDAAGAISAPISEWQSIQFTDGYSQFYQMCDAIEGFNPNATNATASYSSDGIGVDKALFNYAKWYRKNYIPGYCATYGYGDWSGEMNVQCFDTYNTSMEVFHDWTADNGFDRPWIWMTCNEPFAYWQTGAPRDIPTVTSRLVTAEYYQRQCELWFPTEGNYTFASNRGKTTADLNAQTGGWFNTNTTRVLSSEGQYDPWRSASVSSEFRPGGPFAGTETAPVILIEGSRHCNDLLVKNQVHQPILDAMNQEVAQIKAWVGEFYTEKTRRTRRIERGALGL